MLTPSCWVLISAKALISSLSLEMEEKKGAKELILLDVSQAETLSSSDK